jgi:undecaprenyl phosphate-alpha-L-ara4N flippase subunit ArnE
VIVVIGVILAILFTVFGQLMLKQADIIKKYRMQLLVTGYASFCITVLISFYLMKHIEFKTFTVIMSLNYVLVMLMSALFFKESLSINKIIGTLLVLCGALLFNF